MFGCGTSCPNAFRLRSRVAKARDRTEPGPAMKRLAIAVIVIGATTLHVFGQGRGAPPGAGAPGGGFPGGGGPPGGRAGFGGARGGQAGALFDMTGYWVSVVGEDWRWRAFPQKG